MKRRDFFAITLAGGLAALCPEAAKPSRFTLWQLPCHSAESMNGTYDFNTPDGNLVVMPFKGNSYVFRTVNGKLIVMDGGCPPETEYLRNFLKERGNAVDAWFLSHPHTDHVGAFHNILREPKELTVNKIYHSEFSEAFYESVESKYVPMTRQLYHDLHRTKSEVVNVTEPQTVVIDGVNFEILTVKNEEMKEDAYNNSSMVIRVSDAVRSCLFLADSGLKRGQELLAGKFRDRLNCDFMQMAHHGEGGVGREFYEAVKFQACLWATTKNSMRHGMAGELRKWTEKRGVTKHFVSADGLAVVR
jgi:beta-lactamase superfamily II metal-dependent hydrolase